MSVNKILINGQWVEGEDRVVEVRSPFDSELVAEVSHASGAQMEAALAASSKAFETTKDMPSHAVSDALLKIRDFIQENAETFAQALAKEAGKPIRTARVEVDRAVHTFETAAGESMRLYGETFPVDQKPWGENRFALVERFPLGVISAITPFNFPLNLVAHKIAPAIASKNTCVQRPATQTPLSSLLLGKAVMSSDLPAGTVNVLPCSTDVASPMVEDPRVKLLSFTGSGAVGWDLKKRAFKIPVCLELGGNAGVIIHSDANLDYAIAACANAGFLYAGQSCISVQRIFVHDDVADDFTQQFVEKVEAFVVGDPLSEETDIGPMIAESEAIRAKEWIDEAVAAGAKILTGGERDGTMLQPTILTNTAPEMKVNCQEIFAPVVTIVRYSDFEDAVRQVDNSDYGLQAGVFTQDVNRIRHAYKNIRVGGLMVNEVPTWRIDHMPYGGVKESGNTREGIRYAMESMTEEKLMVINFG
ncbi:MAG: aldehyde dehydrogenase family protein [Fidelibacterota bacterium]